MKTRFGGSVIGVVGGGEGVGGGLSEGSTSADRRRRVGIKASPCFGRVGATKRRHTSSFISSVTTLLLERGEKKKSQDEDLSLYSEQIESQSPDAGSDFRHIKKTRQKNRLQTEEESRCHFLRVQQRESRNRDK